MMQKMKAPWCCNCKKAVYNDTCIDIETGTASKTVASPACRVGAVFRGGERVLIPTGLGDGL